MKRGIIEDLRPTILDNFGLIAALRWHVKHVRTAARVMLSEQYPNPEPIFTASAALHIFRIVQDALALSVRHKTLDLINVSVIEQGHQVVVTLADNVPCGDRQEERDSNEYLCMQHRTQALGGSMDWVESESGGTSIVLVLPRATTLAASQGLNEES